MVTPGIARKLNQEFSPKYNISINPDFPHLITEPDVLMGGDGSLFAIFIPKYHEKKNPEEILYRLALSRLGLPNHTISVLLSKRGDFPDDIANRLVWDFDLFVTEEDLSSLETISKNNLKVRSDSDEKALRVIKHWNLARYGRVYIENQRITSTQGVKSDAKYLYNQLKGKQGYEPVEKNDWVRSPIKTKKSPKVAGSIYIRENIILSATEFANRKNDLARLRNFCYKSINTSYSLDTGIPYPQKPTIQLLLIDELPSYKLDPEKSLRASAFTGIVLLKAENGDEIEYLSDKMEKSLRKLKYEYS